MLFTPGNNWRMVQKAKDLPADAIIIDLEDAVPITEKETARVFIEEGVQLIKTTGKQVFIRVNSFSTGLIHEDLKYAIIRDIDGIILSKTESKEDILHSTYRPENSYTAFDDIYDLFFPRFQESEELNRKGRMVYRIEEIMTRDVIAVDEDATLEEVCKLMYENGIHRIPIVRDKIVVGIVNAKGIFKFIAEGESEG